MKCCVVGACGLLFLCSASAHSLVAKVTPVQKVLSMMREMKVRADKSMWEEEKAFNKYADWVGDQQAELNYEIKTGKAEIEKLSAFIEEADNDIEKLGKQIAGLQKDVDTMETDIKDSTTLREKERSLFLATEQNLAESVEAIEKATQIVKDGSQDQEQATSLLQGMATTNPQMPLVLAAFLEEQDQLVGAPSADAYQGQSDGVIAMLNKLEIKFKKELDETQLVESNKAHAYDLEMQHLADTVKDTNTEISDKQAAKGTRTKESAQAKGQRAKAKDELAEDQKLLAEMIATYKNKKAMFATNQKTRKDELAAITKAIEIISSPKVAESYSKNIKLAQVTSLLQTKSSTMRVVSRQRVSRFLEQRAQLLSSKSLQRIASEVAASPFAKVIGLLKGLIAKLKEEAAAEAKHNAWCTEQMASNKKTRDGLTTISETLEAQIEGKTGAIDTMSKEIATLSAERAALLAAMKKATELRTEEKARNTKTINDAIQGGDATKAALTLLKKFYSSQAFIQQVPDMDKYRGEQGSSKGIIGMLEIIESDFRKLKAETSADEMMAIKEYEKFMNEAGQNESKKSAKEKKLRLDRDQASSEKRQAVKDYKLTQDKLGAANKFYDYLKPTCLEVKVSYDERVARRAEEIKALQEAYGILDEKSD